MTSIRDLLDDLVEPISVSDSESAAAEAWDDARRGVRRDRLYGLAGVAAAAVIALVVGLAVGTHSRPQPARPGPTVASPQPSVLVHGTRVDIGPTLAAEGRLPAESLGLPHTIDLDPSAPAVQDAPIDRAQAAFAIQEPVGAGSTQTKRVVLIAADGTQRTLDVTGLGPPPDRLNPAVFVPTSLSLAGTRLVFAQTNAIAVFSLRTLEWRRYPVTGLPYDATAHPVWLDGSTVGVGDKAVSLVTGTVFDPPNLRTWPLPATFDSTWGPQRDTGTGAAQSGYLKSPTIPGEPQAEGIAATAGPTSAILVMPSERNVERYKGCCAVAGWSGAEVVYESRFGSEADGQTTRLLTWDIVAGTLHLASTVRAPTRTTTTGSYADFDVGG